VTTVVYRGVLQRSRLRLLLSALGDLDGPNRFVWLSTKPVDHEQVGRLTAVLDDIPIRYEWEIVDGALAAFAAGRQRVAALLEAGGGDVAVIGQSALPYLPFGRAPITLCMNGIPEERVLQRPGAASRAWSEAAWALYRAALRPRTGSTAVTVSTRMSDLVRRRLGVGTTVEAPTAAGEEYFRGALPPPDERELDFCYQGSGAAWQDLPRLNAVWREIVALRPEARFLVLSYDPRCRALADGMPSGSVELVEAFDAADVARHLSRCRVGFVLRRRDLVNQVSFPTKIGESLGCGVALVLTDIDWDPADLLVGSPVARIVDADSSPAATARAAVELLEGLTPDSPSDCRRIAEGLRRDRLVAVVRAALHRDPIDVDA
jgi:hypothetical protein